MFIRKILLIVIFLGFNFPAKITLTESYYHSSLLKELNKCFETENNDECKDMILHMERMQSEEYFKGNLKCQTSILGLQSELIRNIYFESNVDYVPGKTIPFLIKNC